MEDEGVRALYAPRESTSVWRADADRGTTVVATLAQMGNVAIPTRSYGAEVVDPARYEASGVVQIQIVKRNGQFVPVVDGLVPPTQTDANGNETCLINHHRGMHEDLETKTWVFSPCAVSVCVEDGQPFPERCTVSIWQHLSLSKSTTLTTPSAPVKLGDRLIYPFAVSDPVASIVYVPLPMRHSQQPRVVIEDLSAVIRFDEYQNKKALWAFFSTSMEYIGLLAMEQLDQTSLKDMIDKVKWVVWTPGWVNAAAEYMKINLLELGRKFLFRIAPHKQTWLAWSYFGLKSLYAKLSSRLNLSALFGGLDPNQYAWWQQLPTRSTTIAPGQSWVTDFLRNFPSAAAAAAFLCLKLGAPSFAAVSKVLGKELADAMAGEQWNSLDDSAKAERFRALLGVYLTTPNKLLNLFVEGIKAYVEQPLRPKAIKRYFTIGELSTVIESLAAIMPATEEQLESATGKRKFASEAVVLQWLIASDKNWAFFQAFKDFDLDGLTDGGGLHNRLDMSEFDMHPNTAIEVRVHIDIEDPTSDAHCDGKGVHFEFGTNRQDMDYAGFAAAGIAHDIRRLQDAIRKFDRVLKEQSLRLTWSDTYNTFLDRWIFDPLYKLVMHTWKFHKRDKNLDGSTASEPGYDGEVLLLLQRYRSYTFRYLRKHLDQKLKARFVNPTSEGDVLLKKIERATRMRFLTTVAPAKYLRELPQKVQEPTYLFPLSKHMGTDYVDVEIETGTMREFSPLHDAVQAATRAAQSARTAITPMHRKWETEGQRCLFVHAVEGMTSAQWLLAMRKYALIPPQEAYTLVLQLPGDIRAAEATVRLEEETERRIRTLCHKGDAAANAKTLLDALTLPDTEAGLVAMLLFAELWTDELLRLHARSEFTQSVETAVQTAQARAASRCEACGKFVEATTTKDWAGFLPMYGEDPALLATQAGRDAARLGRRMQLAAQPVTSRGVLSRVMVLRLRAISKALIVTGHRLADKPESEVLPSEPLQALFMDPAHGLRAFARAMAFPTLDYHVVAAVAGAYPSSLLLTDAQASAPDAIAPFGAPLKTPTVPEYAAQKVRERMAALRFNYPATVHLDASKTALHSTTDDLTDAMSSLALDNDTLAFYVPYGHGHAPPRLVYPPVPAPMFGSVPVWVSDVLASIKDLSDSLQTTPSTAARIWPTFPCDGSVLNTAHPDPGKLPAHPSIIEVDATDLYSKDVRFWASEPELGWSPRAEVFKNANAAARAHVQTEMERKLASRVSTLAWNAERTMQCLLVLVGQQAGASLVLGNGDARVAVPGSTESASARKARLERELEEARYDAESCANLHFAELRLLMSRIEAYIEDPDRFVLEPQDVAAAAAPTAAPAAAPASTNVSLESLDATQHVVQAEDAANSMQRREELDTQVSLKGATTAAAGAAGAITTVLPLLRFGYDVLIWLNPANAALNLKLIASIVGASVLNVLSNLYEKRRATVARAKELYGSTSTTGLPAVKASSTDCELPLARSTSVYGDPKTYVEELVQLRNPAISTVAELRREDCPEAPEAWELWRQHAESIERLALTAFLDEDVLEMRLKSKAPFFDPDANFVPNPSSERRAEVYKKLTEALAIADRSSEYDVAQINAGLTYYRSLLDLSAGRYYKRKQALEAHEREVATQLQARAAAQRHVRVHTVAAAAIGAALARGVLGDGAPKLVGLLGPESADQLGEDEREAMKVALEAMRATFAGPASGKKTGRPTALRLGELCAITQSVLA